MSYDYVFTAEAASQFDRYCGDDPLVGDLILGALDELCRAPARLSRPSSAAAEPPGYQWIDIAGESNDREVLFQVAFRYGADEQTLIVHVIGRVFGPRA